MRTYRFMFPVLLAMTATGSLTAKPSDKGGSGIQFPEVSQVKIEDAFWKPKLDLWQKVTVNDVFDKFEGKHLEHSVIRLRTLTVWQRASEISVSMQVLPGLTDLFTKQSVGWQT